MTDELLVAASKSCDVEVSQDFVSVCSPVSGRWKKSKPTTIGWRANVSNMIVAMENPKSWLDEMKESNDPITVRLFDTNMGMYQVGEAWIESWKVGAAVGPLATFDITLLGDGELRDSTSDDYPLFNSGIFYMNAEGPHDVGSDSDVMEIGGEVGSDGVWQDINQSTN